MPFLEVVALLVLFYLIATLYSSTGFGGGSSYLALLSLFALPFTQMRTAALLCNLVVVTNSLILYYKSGQLDQRELKRYLPFLLSSIPLSFLGGIYPIREKIFFALLGISLVLASVSMFFSAKADPEDEMHKNSFWESFIVGGGIGGLAGLVGIGGGIFLSPYLHISNWGKAKKIAVFTSFFILINSAMGLSGQLLNDNFDIADIYLVLGLAFTVFFGSMTGTHLNLKRYSNRRLRQVTAMVILLAGINVLKKLF